MRRHSRGAAAAMQEYLHRGRGERGHRIIAAVYESLARS
jgi:hypothetical protein